MRVPDSLPRRRQVDRRGSVRRTQYLRASGWLVPAGFWAGAGREGAPARPVVTWHVAGAVVLAFVAVRLAGARSCVECEPCRSGRAVGLTGALRALRSADRR